MVVLSVKINIKVLQNVLLSFNIWEKSHIVNVFFIKLLSVWVLGKKWDNYKNIVKENRKRHFYDEYIL